MYRVRIKKAPVMANGGPAFGGQQNFTLQVNGSYPSANPSANEGYSVRTDIPATSRANANIEAERGETVLGDFNNNGLYEHYRINGQPHSKGGTPLSVPNNSFIFSNTRKLKIGGAVLEEFGKNPKSRKKYSFAQLAKLYDLNRYQAILQNENSDRLDQDTATLMMNNYQQKLGKLALLQEGIKGFPQGIPAIAAPLLGKSQEELAEPADSELPPPSSNELVKAQQGRTIGVNPYGVQQFANWLSSLFSPSSQTTILGPYIPGAGTGNTKTAGADAPAANAGNTQTASGATNTQTTSDGNTQSATTNSTGNPPGSTIPSWFKLWTKSNTPKGAISPTGKSTVYDAARGNALYDDYRYWSSVAGRPFKDAKDYQLFVYNQVRNADPNALWKMWGDYGLTAAGLANGEDPNWGFGDGLFGARTAELSHWRPPPANPPQKKEPVHPNSTSGWKTGEDSSMPWWTQDMINMGASVANRFNIHKYMPTLVTPGVYLPTPTFFDPTRQLAANQEAAAQQNLAAALFRGDQGLRSVGSSIQGQAANNAANILGQVQNQNVAVANQNEMARAELLNRKSTFDATALKNYLDELAIMNQQYDNSKRLANENMRINLLSGLTNAQKSYWGNKLNNQYQINPSTGRMYFTKGKGINESGSGQVNTNPLQTYTQAYDAYMKQIENPTLAHEFAMRLTFGNSRSKDDDNAANFNMLQMYPGAMMYGNPNG